MSTPWWCQLCKCYVDESWGEHFNVHRHEWDDYRAGQTVWWWRW